VVGITGATSSSDPVEDDCAILIWALLDGRRRVGDSSHGVAFMRWQFARRRVPPYLLHPITLPPPGVRKQ
jgi:hypothetical protein